MLFICCTLANHPAPTRITHLSVDTVRDSQSRHEIAIVGAVKIEVLVGLSEPWWETAGRREPWTGYPAAANATSIHVVRNLEEVPANAHVDGQLSGGFPFILEIGAPAILPRRGPGEPLGAGTLR